MLWVLGSAGLGILGLRGFRALWAWGFGLGVVAFGLGILDSGVQIQVWGSGRSVREVGQGEAGSGELEAYRNPFMETHKYIGKHN